MRAVQTWSAASARQRSTRQLDSQLVSARHQLHLLHRADGRIDLSIKRLSPADEFHHLILLLLFLFRCSSARRDTLLRSAKDDVIHDARVLFAAKEENGGPCGACDGQ
ncbi:hypothetical protein FA09DRAFT_169377 [Tilletiopsis washingtonensis]|uniref:Uncharacterized protein n=1 Tax=Tilletiopsis washingtonensis TaxID=58919 RepID=A0A316Z3P4_9BASI|nr:hypothetical protein FA09DRAFT_169377 [Tilletiopsis washingtonensis]PWN94803.1 hypothetical protein FA09DRAFT_169377 [Tilletiopsis washingtonensis]